MKNFGEDSIRITLDINDLEEKHINFHEFMSNPIDSQALFFDMLDQAEKEVGFVARDCNIRLEALATSNGNFILTVTKVLPEAEKTNNIPRKKIKVKRKMSNMTSGTCAVFEFNSFDNFCDYGTSLTSSLLEKIHKSIGVSKLYLYNNRYYLILDEIVEDVSFIKSFCASILEFGKLISNSKIHINKIMEHGKVIIKKDAISFCNAGFKK